MDFSHNAPRIWDGAALGDNTPTKVSFVGDLQQILFSVLLTFAPPQIYGHLK
jgi:hypothetical protein